MSPQKKIRAGRRPLWWWGSADTKPEGTPWALGFTTAAVKILDARRTPEQRTAWLLELVQRGDLACLDDNGVRKLQTEIGGFCLEEQNTSGPGVGLHAQHYANLTARRLAVVAEQLRAEIGKTLAGGPWWGLKATGVTRSIFRDHRTGRGVESIDSDDPETVLFWGAQTLIKDHMERILSCQECTHWFLKVKRQLFCSNRCAHRVAARNWKNSHPGDASDIRHRSYVKKVAKTNPAKAQKIARRGPRQGTSISEGP